MKCLLGLAGLLTIMCANAQEKVFIGTLHQGMPNQITISKNSKNQSVKITAANVIDWFEELEVEETSKVIPGLSLEKKILRYNGRVIGKKKFFENNYEINESFYKDQAQIETTVERYCSDYFINDCLKASYRYHVFLVIF